MDEYRCGGEERGVCVSSVAALENVHTDSVDEFVSELSDVFDVRDCMRVVRINARTVQVNPVHDAGFRC